MTSFIRALTDRIRGTAPHRQPGPLSDNPQWHGLPQEAVDRLAARYQRLHDAFSRKYRLDGNLTIPYFHAAMNGRIYTTAPQPHRAALSAGQAHAQLSAQQQNVLIRTILAQIDQLQSLGFVHGALCPEQLVIFRSGKLFVGSIASPEHGRFTDEPMNAENEYASDCMSPEMLRRIAYPASDARPDDDIFSAGCLFHLLLTGRTPAPDGMSAAQALCRAVPVIPSTQDAVYDSLLSRMLSPDPALRPSAAQLLDALNERPCTPHAADRRFIKSAEGSWQLARRLSHLWDPGAATHSELLQAQHQLCSRELARIRDICARSRNWNAAVSAIPIAKLLPGPDVPCVHTAMPDCALPLRQLHIAEPSIFILDARFTEILYAAQAIHDDGYILGAISEELFCAELGEHSSRICLTDIAVILPLDKLPQPQELCIDRSAAQLLSPELAQYICSPHAGAAADARGWIGPGSDIFSLGLIYHLLLTGEYPLLTDPEQPTYACAAAFDTGSSIRLSERLDAPHSELIARMLSMDPLSRPARCDAIACEIMEFYTG